MMRQPLVYVIVLNYNSLRWLNACFQALRATQYENFRVLLADNDSTDGSVEWVRASFPEIEVLENHANRGFSEGNNQGIRLALKAGAEYVVLLNPDTCVEPAWLAQFVAVGERETRVGILGAVQLEYDGNGFNAWTRTAASTHLQELDHIASARAWIPMEWVEGACLAIKRQVLEKVGLLDPIYFSFYEEIDLCRRAICRGYEIALVPRSRIHHFRGGSWEADQRIKRQRDYRCDRSQFIFAATDPRNNLWRNLIGYFVTLGTKIKDLASNFSLSRTADLLRMQADLLLTMPAIFGKWRADRGSLAKS